MSYTQIPQVVLTDSAVQKAFNASVKNLMEINTIACDFAVYNATGLLNPEVPFMMRAGGSYQTPWTRDAAINTWCAGRLLEPKVAKNTLYAVCVKDADGNPIIQPDDQRWDRCVWCVGAWQYYLATGDMEFLAVARGIVERALKRLDEEWFCEETGLYRGGSFFNDGISGYPRDIYMPGKDHSFMGEHPATETICSFSTNCIYCEAWRILDRMNAILGVSDGEPAKRHAALKAAILRTFWNQEENKCNYLLYPDGRIDPSQELAGISFGVLFGILPEKALENLMQEAYGIPSIMPPFPGLFHKERPGRHNNLVWPFLNGFYIQAAAGAGKVNLAGEELKKMAALYNSNEGIFEIYNPYDGSVDGGWQIGGDDLQGHLWDSCPDQTWSATSYIGAVLQGIFGIRMEEEGIRFAPCVPEFLKDSSVRNLVIRGKKFHVTLSGFGTEVAEMTVNGKTVDTARLSYADAEEKNEIVLTLK